MIDVVIATAGKRKSLIPLVKMHLHSYAPVRVNILYAGDVPEEFYKKFTEEELSKIRVYDKQPLSKCGSQPIIDYFLNEKDKHEWSFVLGDEENITYWGLKCLWDSRDSSVGFVAGKSILVMYPGYDTWRILSTYGQNCINSASILWRSDVITHFYKENHAEWIDRLNRGDVLEWWMQEWMKERYGMKLIDSLITVATENKFACNGNSFGEEVL